MATDQQRASSNVSDPLIGKKIGNFRLEKKIGRGGFGAVYRAKQVFVEKDYAIKVLHVDRQMERDVIKRFQREAKALAKLQHDNIVKMSDFGLLPDYGFYLVMEYLQGASLQECIKENQSFPLARIANLVRQLCQALDFVHGQGIVHRDLKPANIFLQDHEEQGPEEIKLIDFGIASLTQENDALTKTGTYLGTARYASPEQAQGQRDLDGRSDLYALGIILFLLLSKRLPFRGGNSASIIYHQIHTPPPMLHESAPWKQWSPQLENFLNQALAKDPDLRPSDATAFWQQCDEAFQAQTRLEQQAQSAPATQEKATFLEMPSFSPEQSPQDGHTLAQAAFDSSVGQDEETVMTSSMQYVANDEGTTFPEHDAMPDDSDIPHVSISEDSYTPIPFTLPPQDPSSENLYVAQPQKTTAKNEPYTTAKNEPYTPNTPPPASDSVDTPPPVVNNAPPNANPNAPGWYNNAKTLIQGELDLNQLKNLRTNQPTLQHFSHSSPDKTTPQTTSPADHPPAPPPPPAPTQTPPQTASPVDHPPPMRQPPPHDATWKIIGLASVAAMLLGLLAWMLFSWIRNGS